MLSGGDGFITRQLFTIVAALTNESPRLHLSIAMA
jgi:hypothetical protein